MSEFVRKFFNQEKPKSRPVPSDFYLKEIEPEGSSTEIIPPRAPAYLRGN
jgi:hypothetical protein